MKNKKLLHSFVIILITFISLSIAGCGGSTDSTNPGPEPEPEPEPPSGISFDSGNLSPGASFSFTFEEVGSADYICTIHPTMQGSVTVEEGGSTDDVTVTITGDMQFSPANITIGAGTEVTWVNQDDLTHTATSQ